MTSLSAKLSRDHSPSRRRRRRGSELERNFETPTRRTAKMTSMLSASIPASVMLAALVMSLTACEVSSFVKTPTTNIRKTYSPINTCPPTTNTRSTALFVAAPLVNVTTIGTVTPVSDLFEHDDYDTKLSRPAVPTKIHIRNNVPKKKSVPKSPSLVKQKNGHSHHHDDRRHQKQQSASSKHIVAPKVAKKQTAKAKKQSRPLTKQEEQFQWLNWVYCQWKDKSPGKLKDANILKQMMAAIPRWARRKSLASAQRAEELLERLVLEAASGNPLLLPNEATATNTTAGAPLTVAVFNGAMDAYGKIGNPKGVQRILRRMESLRTEHSTFFSHLQPDAFSMSILATAWAKSRSPEAAQKAEAILQYMDLNGLVPNTVTYNAVLNAIAVGNQLDKAVRAEDIVRQMKRRHKEEGHNCAPDVYTYQSLIQAWSKTTLPGSPQRAERILRYMDEASESNKALRPNAYCFTTVIHAWARSSEAQRARSAYNLLNTLTRRCHDSKNSPKVAKQMRPNVKTFTAVLNACSRPVDESESDEAFSIAKLAMAELSLGTYGQPNFLSYAAFLLVCATTLPYGYKRDAIVKSTFEDCVKAGQVGQIVLEKLHLSASPELVDELIGEYRDPSGNINIPKHWKSRIQGERGSGSFLPTPKVTEDDVDKMSKSSKRRFEAVQKFGGQSGVLSCSHEEQDESISWSRGGFGQANNKQH